MNNKEGKGSCGKQIVLLPEPVEEIVEGNGCELGQYHQPSVLISRIVEGPSGEVDSDRSQSQGEEEMSWMTIISCLMLSRIEFMLLVCTPMLLSCFSTSSTVSTEEALT